MPPPPPPEPEDVPPPPLELPPPLLTLPPPGTPVPAVEPPLAVTGTEREVAGLACRADLMAGRVRTALRAGWRDRLGRGMAAARAVPTRSILCSAMPSAPESMRTPDEVVAASRRPAAGRIPAPLDSQITAPTVAANPRPASGRRGARARVRGGGSLVRPTFRDGRRRAVRRDCASGSRWGSRCIGRCTASWTEAESSPQKSSALAGEDRTGLGSLSWGSAPIGISSASGPSQSLAGWISRVASPVDGSPASLPGVAGAGVTSSGGPDRSRGKRTTLLEGFAPWGGDWFWRSSVSKTSRPLGAVVYATEVSSVRLD